MIITQHQGLEIRKGLDPSQRKKDIYKFEIKEIPDLTMTILVTDNFVDPLTQRKGKETTYYIIEINSVLMRFSNLKIAEIYFDILTKRTPWSLNLDVKKYIEEKYSEYLI